MNYITYKDWEKTVLELGGELWEIGKPLPTKPLVFSTAEHVDILFREVFFSEYDKEFVLVSAASDFGPVLQHKNPVWKDIYKWVNMDEGLNEKMTYHDYICRARCAKDRCYFHDRYSFKAYVWTESTFPIIPKQIKHWFVANCQISDGRVTPIPFGIHPDSVKHIHTVGTKKSKVLASWTNTSNERQTLQRWLKDVATTEKMSVEDYFSALNSCKYNICPEGNGLDSYRILETLYCGKTPIIVSIGDISWTRAYEKIFNYRGAVCRPNEVLDLIKEDITVESSEYLYMDAWKELICTAI